MKKKVFVSGCFDMLHSGHVAFFEEAAKYGDLYVGIGSDRTIYELKGRSTINSEQERLFMIRALKPVKEARVNTGSGVLDFKETIREVGADVLFVNEDGHSPLKQKLCRELGIEYVISRRIPHDGLPVRSTTALRSECHIPYRIDLAGGWLDQPYVSKYSPGPVITISIEPDYEFSGRSGMATSTRNKAIELWETNLPEGDREKQAKILFSYENPPGSDFVSGSQDSIGIVFPGLNYLWYDKGDYWPSRITSVDDEDLLDWLEKRIYLQALEPREGNFKVTEKTNITAQKAKQLALVSNKFWEAVMNKNANAAAEAMTESFHAQIAMFPLMKTEEVAKAVEQLPDCVLGYKLSGAGGGGYLVLFSDSEVKNTMKIKIRRPIKTLD